MYVHVSNVRTCKMHVMYVRTCKYMVLYVLISCDIQFIHKVRIKGTPANVGFMTRTHFMMIEFSNLQKLTGAVQVCVVTMVCAPILWGASTVSAMMDMA